MEEHLAFKLTAKLTATRTRDGLTERTHEGLTLTERFTKDEMDSRKGLTKNGELNSRNARRKGKTAVGTGEHGKGKRRLAPGSTPCKKDDNGLTETLTKDSPWTQKDSLED